MFPSPQELGLPDKFKAWRPNQARVIQDALESKKRVKLQLQRPGAGKSVSYMAVALMLAMKKLRTLILTINKSLQDQLMDDFAEIGLVDIRGKSSYDCQAKMGQSCETGYIAKCPFRGTGICPHSAAKTAASEALFVTSNYSCLMAANHYGQGFGKFDLLILDEGHDAPEQLAKAMQVRISMNEMEMIGHDWPDHRERQDMEAWKYWALVSKKLADSRIADEESGHKGKVSQAQADRFKHLKNLSRKLADLGMSRADNWVCEEWAHGYQFDPIEASRFAERLLLCKIPNIIITSGNIQPRVTTELGIEDDDFEFFEYFERGDTIRSPFYWLKSGLNVRKAVQDWEIAKVLIPLIDRIVEARPGVKGTIHTGNFHIRDLIMRESAYGDNGGRLFMSNYLGGPSTGALLESFKKARAPRWFVSPSIGTGVDLAHDQCRVQIIAKLPFGDKGSLVEQARNERDPTRFMAKMFERLGQQYGRGDRAEDDWQEVFVIDDLISWAMWKFPDLVPMILGVYYRPITDIPPAPKV